MRECYACGSIKSYIDKTGREHWYKNGIGNNWLCENCNNKYVKNPKWHPITHPITNKKLMSFRGKIISLSLPPRTGYCSLCPRNIHNGSCKRTHIHHIKYHEDNPLEDTVELCVSCHKKIHFGKLTN